MPKKKKSILRKTTPKCKCERTMKGILEHLGIKLPQDGLASH